MAVNVACNTAVKGCQDRRQTGQTGQRGVGVHSSTDLFGDVKVEDHHAEVVDYEGPSESVGLAVLHIFRPHPQEDQVQAADGQGGKGG